VLRRLEEDKKERAEKFATHHALAQQAAAAHGPAQLNPSPNPNPNPNQAAAQAQPPSSSASSSSGPTSTLSLRTEDGALRHTFPAEATLLEVRASPAPAASAAPAPAPAPSP